MAKQVPERMPGKRRPSGGLTAEERKRSATIKEHKPGPRGGEHRDRFPLPDVQHARLALADLPKAKGLTSAQKAEIRAKADGIIERAGGHVSKPAGRKPAKRGK